MGESATSLRRLLATKSGTRSEQLRADQLRLFAQELGISPASEDSREDDGQHADAPPPAAGGSAARKPRGRQSAAALDARAGGAQSGESREALGRNA